MDVFNKSDHIEVPFLSGSASFMDDIVVSNEDVTKLLKDLNPSKALGPDELHPKVLKELPAELVPVFAHLFQKSLDTGEIPKEWSLTNICPLYKKGDRPLACNYRPVSLTCVPCKLLEHIVCSNIMAHLDDYKLLSDRQHAFRIRPVAGQASSPEMRFSFLKYFRILYPFIPNTIQINQRPCNN